MRATLLGLAVAALSACGDADLDRLVTEVNARRAIRADANMRVVHNPLAAERPCPADAETWFVVGQSNAAGSAQDPHEPLDGDVYVRFRGRCYAAVLPLLGASSMPQEQPHYNPFLLIAHRYSVAVGKPVVLHLFAIGGRGIQLWSTDQAEVLRAELAAAAPVDRLLWQQGETDALQGMDATTYMRHFAVVAHIARQSGVLSGVHVAAGSRCYGLGADNPVHAAQAALQDAGLVGPDTDTLGPEYRHDGCHFNAAGVREVADLWLAALLKES